MLKKIKAWYNKQAKNYADYCAFVNTVREMRKAQLANHRMDDMINYQNARYYEGEVDRLIWNFYNTKKK